MLRQVPLPVATRRSRKEHVPADRIFRHIANLGVSLVTPGTGKVTPEWLLCRMLLPLIDEMNDFVERSASQAAYNTIPDQYKGDYWDTVGEEEMDRIVKE